MHCIIDYYYYLFLNCTNNNLNKFVWFSYDMMSLRACGHWILNWFVIFFRQFKQLPPFQASLHADRSGSSWRECNHKIFCNLLLWVCCSRTSQVWWWILSWTFINSASVGSIWLSVCVCDVLCFMFHVSFCIKYEEWNMKSEISPSMDHSSIQSFCIQFTCFVRIKMDLIRTLCSLEQQHNSGINCHIQQPQKVHTNLPDFTHLY